ncbi:hypothetical protein [Pseudomonas sp. BMS12]|uniref:hypothetical protein n=1 Tax=Pseudomonas sp. BMS12 TaxID=1796033 RepID=UPI00083B5EC4|nr:hypothetical protein [Pseudomonas sp. BMS12]
MNISGIGGQQALSLTSLRNKEGFRETELASPTPASAPPPAFKPEAGYDHQSEEAYEEAFAKLRVNLQHRATEDGVASSIGQGTLSASLDAEDPALKAFHDYMAMTPAEKMRDAILKEMGLTEEEVDAMSPEQQEAVENEIAERMQQRAELQAAKEIEERAEGVSAANDDPQEKVVLMS